MQAIALILSGLGYEVSGSDTHYGEFYNILTDRGITIDIGTNAENILSCDVVIYSLAIKADNPELMLAKEAGISMYSRTEFLALLQKKYPNVVAVSGTHGKSTTTYLISSILHNADFKATYHIGASSETFACGGKYIGDEYLISEACEYRDSFLAFNSTVGVILNIEKDHPDYFKDIDQLLDSFVRFSTNIRENGILIVNSSYKDFFAEKLANIRQDISVIGVGNNGEYHSENLSYINDKPSFDVYRKDKKLFRIVLNMYGEHNIFNALIAIAVAKYYNVDDRIIIDTLQNVKPLARRFQSVGEYNGAKIITDYAHHPSEIKAVITTTKNITKGRVIVCFQPHTYSRTTDLFLQFVECFEYSDKVIITKTFKSREVKSGKSSFDLFLELCKINDNVVYYDDFLGIAKYLKKELKPDDALLLLGAGNINEVANLLVND